MARHEQFERPPRSILSFGGHDKKNYERAITSGADTVMADFEDACPEEFRGDPVRATYAEMVRNHGSKVQGGIGVRVNGNETGLIERDIAAVISIASEGHNVPFVMIPKVNDRGVLGAVTEAFLRARRTCAELALPALIPIIEHPLPFRGERLDGIANAVAEWEAGGGLLFGTLDFATSAGIPGWASDSVIRDQENSLLLPEKSAIRNAARAAGIFVLDGAFLTVARRDDDTLRHQDVAARLERSTKGSYDLGMDGRLVIHPSQVEVVNGLYGPNESACNNAVRCLALWVQAGGGVLIDPLKGDMIDGASIRGVRGHLAIAEFGIEVGTINAEHVVPSTGASVKATLDEAHRLLGGPQ